MVGRGGGVEGGGGSGGDGRIRHWRRQCQVVGELGGGDGMERVFVGST